MTPSNPFPPDAPCVLVRPYAGFGNNLFQIVTGLVLAERLAVELGGRFPCRVILPDAVDTAKPFSVFEILGGHLRADNHYGDRHRDFGLPSPFDLPAVLPSLDWMPLADEGEARRALRRAMVEALSPGGDATSWYGIEHYFSRETYLKTCVDPKARAAHNPHVGQVGNFFFSTTTIPFPRGYWDPEARSLAHLFEPDPNVLRYIESTYGIDGREDVVGIHMRNDQRVADIHRTDVTSAQWYVDCVADIVTGGRSPKIVIVSNCVGTNDDSLEAGTALKQRILRRFPHLDVVESNQEPYYVDYFLLRLCSDLIISCSTFSFGAGITSSRMNRMYVPNSYSERHFCNNEFPGYCHFIPDSPGESDA